MRVTVLPLAEVHLGNVCLYFIEVRPDTAGARIGAANAQDSRNGDTMGTFAKALLALGLVAGLVTGAGALAEQKDIKPLQGLMGGNFQIVARILSDLVEGRYDSLPAQAELLVRHAAELDAAPPPGLPGASQRETFLAYSTNFKLAAAQLLTVSETLAKPDPQRSNPGSPSVDALRASAAHHFGNVVTACALCHIQFPARLLSRH